MTKNVRNSPRINHSTLMVVRGKFFKFSNFTTHINTLHRAILELVKNLRHFFSPFVTPALLSPADVHDVCTTESLLTPKSPLSGQQLAFSSCAPGRLFTFPTPQLYSKPFVANTTYGIFYGTRYRYKFLRKITL